MKEILVGMGTGFNLGFFIVKALCDEDGRG